MKRIAHCKYQTAEFRRFTSKRIIGWRWVRGRAGLAGGYFSLHQSYLARSRLEVASRLDPQQRLCRGLRYAVGYARITGRRAGFSTDDRKKIQNPNASKTEAWRRPICSKIHLGGVAERFMAPAYEAGIRVYPESGVRIPLPKVGLG